MPPGPNAGRSPPTITTTTTSAVGTAPAERDSSFRDVSRSPSPLPAVKHQWRGPSIELHATGGRPTTLRNHFPGKRSWANVRLLLRVCSLVCSVITGLLVGAVIATWKHTRSERWADEMLWPKNPQLIPTYYMISASVVTIVAHLGLIIAHCGSKERYLTEAYTKRDRVMFPLLFFFFFFYRFPFSSLNRVDFEYHPALPWAHLGSWRGPCTGLYLRQVRRWERSLDLELHRRMAFQRARA